MSKPVVVDVVNKPGVANAVGAPESVNKITKEYIKAFSKTATPKQQRWIKNHLTTEIEKKGQKNGFFSFRSMFADKFFPEIVAKNKPKKEKRTFLDEILEICG